MINWVIHNAVKGILETEGLTDAEGTSDRLIRYLRTLREPRLSCGRGTVAGRPGTAGGVVTSPINPVPLVGARRLILSLTVLLTGTGALGAGGSGALWRPLLLVVWILEAIRRWCRARPAVALVPLLVSSSAIMWKGVACAKVNGGTAIKNWFDVVKRGRDSGMIAAMATLCRCQVGAVSMKQLEREEVAVTSMRLLATAGRRTAARLLSPPGRSCLRSCALSRR